MESLVRESKRKVLSLLHDIQSRAERLRTDRYLDRYDACVVQNRPPEKAKTVLFILTRMVRFHGGQTSVLRLGTELSRLGCSVSYAVYKAQSQKEMEICAGSCLAGFLGRLMTKEGLRVFLERKKQADIVIATSWDTVSYAKQAAGYKMYFVQDFEPFFYPYGEVYLLAKKTYEQGLHMVSLGAWNKDRIEKLSNPVSPVDVVDFPYEKSEYAYVEKEYAGYREKKKLVIAAYLKFYGKRLPNIVQRILQELKACFLRDGIELDVLYFGEARTFHAAGGKNLGMLTREALLELYHMADFGLCFSFSNISLVPYEMLSAGLPLIEFEDGTFPYFFPEESAVLSSISGEDLYQKLKACINAPEILKRNMHNAKKTMQALSWARTGRQFWEIIDGVCVKK